MRTPSSLRGPPTCLVAAWCAGANRKPARASRRQRAATLGRGRRIEPQRLEHVGRARAATTARGCRAWPRRTPAPATTNAAIVETLTDREPSPPVPQVSTTTSRRERRRGIMRARASPAPRRPPRRRSRPSCAARPAAPPICAGVASPSMICPTTAAISSAVRSAPVDHARERLLDGRSAASRPSRRVLLARGSCAAAPCPTVVRIDSGWNCTPSTGSVLWRTRHDLLLRRSSP